MKKLLALLMAVAMLVLSGAALAEETPESFVFTLSDPYLELGIAGQVQPHTVLDLTGLELSLEGAAAGDALGLTATLLVSGIPAARGLAVADGQDAVVALEGMESSLRMPMEMLVEQGAAVGVNPTMPAGFDAALALAEQIEIVDAGTEEVEFYGGGRLEAKKQTFSITAEQFDNLLKSMNVQNADEMSISVDAAYWTDASEKNTRVEAMYHLVSGEEILDMPLVMQVYAPDEDTAYMKLNMDMQEAGGMDGSMTVVPSEEVEGYPNIFAQFTIEADGETGRLEFVGWPAKVGDSTEYTASLSIVDDVTDVLIGCHALMGDAASSYSFTVYAPGVDLKLGYDAQAIEDGLDGTLTLSYKDDSQFVKGSMGIAFAAGGDAVIPDLSSYTPVDIATMTDADGEQLMTEAQTVLIQAMGALMQIPGVQSLLLSNMV